MKEAAGPGRRFWGPVGGWVGNGQRHKFPLCFVTCWGGPGHPTSITYEHLPNKTGSSYVLGWVGGLAGSLTGKAAHYLPTSHS